MKIRAYLLLVLFSWTLAGCGGYPMTVESRTPPSAADQQQADLARERQLHRQYQRSRGAI